MIVWLILFVVIGFNCFPSGALKSECTTLLLRDPGTQPQTSKAPYEISVELASGKALVRVSSPIGKEFQEFLLQARSSEDPSKFIDGVFTTSELSKTTDCFGSNQNTLTHKNSSPKTEITTEWTPKENLDEEVVFKATVLQKNDVFWTEIYSNPVKLRNNSLLPILEELMYETCFIKEGCVGLPKGCIEKEDCKIFLRYSKSSDGIHFNLQGHLESSKYMAMALSEDAIMGGDSVTECLREGTSVIARESWNEGKANTRTRALSTESYTSSFIDGMTSCSWKSPLVTVANAQTYDFINKKFYILLATGDLMDRTLKYHDHRTDSIEAIDFTEYKVDDPDMDDSSAKNIGNQHPPTTRKEKSSNGKVETTTSASRSSYLSICLMHLIIGLFFASNENINVYFLIIVSFSLLVGFEWQ